MSKKVSTFNGCSYSKLAVNPVNWTTKKASIKSPWRITYRFYDPAFKGTDQWGKMIPLKGMNEYHTLKERQDVTKGIIDNEIELLEKQGYNPITDQFMAPCNDQQISEISPDTKFIDALWKGYEKLDAVPDCLTDIRSVINGVKKAAGQLYDNKFLKRYTDLAISQICTRHIKYLLDQCGKNNPRWSNNRFNKYKAYLSMIFNELKEVECIETNPTRDISSKKKTRMLRAVLTPDEEIKIDSLKNTRYTFWRYIRIFFRSGSRTTELFSLQKNEKVDLKQQEFIVLVKKGKYYREDVRPIPDDVLHLWQEVWNEAKPGQFLFSKNLRPGDRKIRKDQPGRRWKKYVQASESKGGLGINKDFYTLKHLNTDKIAETTDMYHAQIADGHGSRGTTGIYAVNEKRRTINKLKRLTVNFAG